MPLIVAQISPLPVALLGNSFHVFIVPQLAADSIGVYVVWDSFARDQANTPYNASTGFRR